jgi:hypothetical protein
VLLRVFRGYDFPKLDHESHQSPGRRSTPGELSVIDPITLS